MYVVAFGVAFLLYRRQVRERHFPMTEDQLSGLFLWGILALLLGARIFATLVYETSDIYQRQPWLIFWPFRDGRFTGLQGMSYHGGVIGGILGILGYSKVKGFDYRETGDMFAASIPLGYTFGRIGNFINGELYGRVTAGPLGMIFPNAQGFSAQEPWVREAAEKAGIPIPAGNALLNLPRHPSQLYEALFEGVVLWAIIWLVRNRKPFKGFLVGLYLLGYGFFRFILEYFREPDADLGYRIQFVHDGLPPALFSSLFNFSTGQIFNFVMILAGGLWLVAASRLPNRKPVLVYSSSGGNYAGRSGGNSFGTGEENKTRKAEKAAARRSRRKLQKKLR
jgi:phosphatidylglycerol:prolipoprotein diacylglycerol transferase